MSTIRIEAHIDSETLVLPQLKPLIGKDVEILVQEKVGPRIAGPTADWQSVEAAVRGLENYDQTAYREIRDQDLHAANGRFSA